MQVIVAVVAALVWARSYLRSIVDSLVAAAPVAPAAGPINGCKVHLFANDIVPTLNSVVGDFTAPTFTGYAPSAALTFGASFDADDGSAVAVGSNVQFVATADPVAPETIYGYMLTDSAGTGLIAAERFENPVTITKTGDGLAVVPMIAFPV